MKGQNIVWLLLVFSAAFKLYEAAGIQETLKKDVKLSKHPVIVVISYDGFRYDYMEKTETPNLNRVKASGVSVPYMQNQFLTNTFPNHHSIATGRYIESHGIVANFLYDPLYGKVLSGYNDDPGFWNYSSSVLPLWVSSSKNFRPIHSKSQTIEFATDYSLPRLSTNWLVMTGPVVS